MELPGHFSQTLNFGGFEGPAVDYNVVWLDEDTAIESVFYLDFCIVIISNRRYDCNEHIFGVIDYCVHFMSRTPTIQPAKVTV